jgi:aryl-alcohol dehydrogenase-like predicted oxidoreductase
MELSRREMLQLGAGAGAATFLGWRSAPGPLPDLIQRTIPSSGERVPVVGIGTRNYRAGPGEDLGLFHAALRTFAEWGGKVIDTAPSYGNSESIVGDWVAESGLRDDLFIATKVDREGRQEGMARMEASFEALRTDRIDLMQVHNLRDTATHLDTLEGMKADGRIRYIGLTTSSERQYDRLADFVRNSRLDFIQLNYSLASREAANRLLPLALERGVAVLVNLPFGRGRLFRRVGERSLPDWASDFAIESWGQFFLKYIVSHPAVTAVIPGTTKDYHVVDNIGAARGPLPDPATRTRMEELYDGLSGPVEEN